MYDRVEKVKLHPSLHCRRRKGREEGNSGASVKREERARSTIGGKGAEEEHLL